MGRVISIFNQKGGVGKTTTCINLSSDVALQGKKVLVIDLDPQGNTTSGYNINASSVEHNIFDVLSNNCDINDAVYKTDYETYIIPSTPHLSAFDSEAYALQNREYLLKTQLNQIKHFFDYIFIDCPPSLGLLVINALVASDTVLIPIQCEYYALEGVTQLMNTYNLVRSNLNSNIGIEGIVLTMYDGRTNLATQVVDEVRRYFGANVFSTMIPKNIRLAEAPSFGLPIQYYDKQSTGAAAYWRLAKELINKG